MKRHAWAFSMSSCTSDFCRRRILLRGQFGNVSHDAKNDAAVRQPGFLRLISAGLPSAREAIPDIGLSLIGNERIG
jgi:hypothetical protein